MNLSQRAYLTAAAVAALGIFGLAFDAWRSYDRELATAQREAKSLVTVLADHTNRSIQSIDQALDAIAANPDAVLSQGADRQSISESFGRRLGNLPQLLWFSVWNAEGNLIGSASSRTEAVGNVSNQAWFS